MLHIDLVEEENWDLTLNNFSSNGPRLLELCARFDVRPGSAPRAVFGRSGRVRVMRRLHVNVCEITLIPYDPDLSAQIMIWAYYGKVIKGSAAGGFQRLFEHTLLREERRVQREKNAVARRKRNGKRRKQG